MWGQSLTTSQKLQPVRSAEKSLRAGPNRAIGEAVAIKLASNKAIELLDAKEGSIYCRFWKRLIDVVVSSASLVVLSPLLIIVAILVRGTSRGPALYWQDRVGRGGRLFRIAKFRSMFVDAEKQGPDITSSGDPRVTRLGTILRKLKIDELPQLWNVLKGEMSLVGPRPELPRYVVDYNQKQLRVLCVRPGITDPASIRYRHEEEILAKSENPEDFYRNVVLPDKLELNLMYIEKMSFLFDAELLFQTLNSLFL